MSRRLILLRHGQTVYNASCRMQGQQDTVLSDVGRAQARNVAAYLGTLPLVGIISSDLSRARDTAGEVARVAGLEVTTDARLRETYLGNWQGLTHGEIDAASPTARIHWRNDASWAPPGAETRFDVARRARDVVDELMATRRDWDDHTLLIVAHGGTINALTGSLLGYDTARDYARLSTVNNACWATLRARRLYGPGMSEEELDAPFSSDPVHEAHWCLEGWNQTVDAGLSIAGGEPGTGRGER